MHSLKFIIMQNGSSSEKTCHYLSHDEVNTNICLYFIVNIENICLTHVQNVCVSHCNIRSNIDGDVTWFLYEHMYKKIKIATTYTRDVRCLVYFLLFFSERVLFFDIGEMRFRYSRFRHTMRTFLLKEYQYRSCHNKLQENFYFIEREKCSPCYDPYTKTSNILERSLLYFGM